MASYDKYTGMYAVDSYFDADAESIQLPTVMYAVDPYFQIGGGGGGGSAAAGGTLVGGSEARFQALEQRFSKILTDLEGLSGVVSKLEKEFGITPAAAAAAAAQKQGKHGQSAPSSSAAKAPPAKLSASIFCPPGQAPLATLAVLQSVLGKVLVHQQWHSSTPGMPEGFANKHRNYSPDTDCDARVHVIWKNVEDTTTVVSATSHAPILGDANSARLFARLHKPALLGSDALESAQVEVWVETATKFIGANSKEIKGLLKTINSQLGQTEYVAGSQLTLADYVLWAHISNAAPGSLPANIKTWIARMEALPQCSVAAERAAL